MNGKMTGIFHLFISSSPELALEREALGQAVAELPVSFGWQVKHTPRAGQDAQEGLVFIEHCDLFLVVLGCDFAAPMGLEWEHALRTRRPILAYRKAVLRSPSAQGLLRRPNVSWTEYHSLHQLKERFSQALAKYLLDHAEQVGLQLDDVEGLLAEVEKTQNQDAPEPDRREGAGTSGIILSRDP